ncbi:MAG TPA: DUF2946 family protein [Steroidobacteraceae bacterium]|nr:DUF2946 family protein [Steroidobacteraceae bacterium]
MTKRTPLLIWLLLPLLLLRGLVPTGFMVDASQGKLAIVVCPGHILTQGGESGLSASSEHEGHAHHGAPPQQHESSPNQLCPFAAAASAALLPGLTPALTASVPSLTVDVEVSYGPALPAGPIRTQQSRAPPHLS